MMSTLLNRVTNNLRISSVSNIKKLFLLTRKYGTSKKASYSEVCAIVKARTSKILVLTGAGISTASGVPDFRSPGTGLYHNLEKYNLPYPEAVFDINYFLKDPQPFYTLSQEIYPGITYKPNIAHHFIRGICNYGKLQRLYTQNIDGLDRLVGIPENELVEFHGTFRTSSCSKCKKKHDPRKFVDAILKKMDPLICYIDGCQGTIKPDIVFFGELIPTAALDYESDLEAANALLIIGTSLEVYPFAGIVDRVRDDQSRILINKEIVGSLGKRKNDFLLIGDITEIVGNLINELKWNSWLHNSNELLEERWQSASLL